MKIRLELLLLLVIPCLSSTILSGCASDSAAARGAQQGAATGAVSGAVGSMVGALVFGGDVLDAGVRGAVVGGATGATAGAMIGGGQDKAEKARRAEVQRDKAAELRDEIGDDAFNGVVALAECKYAVALANAGLAQGSKNRDFRLAGHWVETLVMADQGREAEARHGFPTIVEQDRKIKTPEQAEAMMRDAMTRLGEIRRDNGLPVVCS